MTKYISAFFLLGCAAVPGLAQSIPVDFATGQAARAFIGQTQAARGEPGASDTLLGGASGIAYANNMLFVADSNRVGSGPDNNRVLIYRNVAGMIPQPTDELFYTQRCPSCVGKADIVLGQPDFTSTNPNQSDVLNTPPSASTMRTPGGVASDGKILVVADTNNNRLLIWNQIPTVNDQPADVVVGQPDFAHASIPGVTPTATSMRGPQGVWLQDGSLFVADTGNNRVLIFNHVPTSNGVAADVVLGVPNFGSAPPETENQVPIPSPSNMLNPVAVTSDGQRLYVTDIGYNRVLIWNSIPTTNQAPADVVIGQPNMNSGAPNNSYAVDSSGNQTKVLCDSTGTDPNNNNAPIFPNSCLATLSFPRYALSDGQRLFVADGGNDRVLVFSNVPTQNGISANYVVGQVGGGINQASDAADSMRTPMAMTWDGVNLYVADTYNRRINVYSPAEHNIPYSGVRNAASFEIFAVGKITIGGDIQEKDVLKVTISGTDYSYTVKKDDTLESIITSVVALINADKGDPNVFALADTVIDAIVLIARAPGSDGNNVEYSTTVTPDTALLAASAEAANLSGGMDAAKIAGGTIVSIVGDNLSDQTAEAPAGAETLPTDLGGTQVYFDGVRAPLLYVSPTQINAQIPYELFDTTSISAWVRTVRRSGLVSVTTPVAVTIGPGSSVSSGGQLPTYWLRRRAR
ncbi:MAG: IPT/TIG domain-containing protein [Acidobacteria bacterium]|nr:IPT/TIG domain-containing protein [Acidobacteriota bacterium]